MDSRPNPFNDHVIDAIIREIARQPVTAGDLMDRTRKTGTPLFRRREALLGILGSGRALARVPLGMVVDGTPILDLALEPGVTTARQIRQAVGRPTSSESSGDRIRKVWILQRIEGRRPAHVPPHPLRDLVNPMRPSNLTLPFGTLVAGERLELRCEFSQESLTWYEFAVVS